ncbi:elongation factor P maturation arginine rhamnosyltransferase EarP [Undibacterium amnicola]|uniref:Protein-arginine rhamnosyltransferase n=1 Tax=Undibacterium amnicola TaxID=1834038 RepID=A0ABR6XP55_9BURK|nr:elongation factor P maturation arginine rhamnosyltransferase EarP [Undibacterium amnicola]MBC3831282.1 elongation factor P maturation arginine rhamnosyltransferase EarP [Undibacterium amnicola]
MIQTQFHPPSSPSTSLALFCKVIDNFGDIGICWRLARQLSNEHQITVTLWVDDLISFKKICPELDVETERQIVQNIHVRHWRNQDAYFEITEIADIVIEFFGCDIPPNYIATMSKCQPKPVWLNLEGLSAEEWVEGCHTLPSSHPQYPLTKYFFFPGFTYQTGGLLLENNLIKEREQFVHAATQVNDFLKQLGLTPEEMNSFKVSMFCYPHAPLSTLFDTWKQSNEAITCLVPAGVANEAVSVFLESDAIPGANRKRGNLTLRVIPFVPQNAYDKLLWSCDLNFVRGEDSFVRAQWAGKAFIWHIYPQDENLHHKKLQAFLNAHTAESTSSRRFALAWNAALTESDWSDLWLTYRKDLTEIQSLSLMWQQKIQSIGDMTSNLLSFINSKIEKRPKIG